MHKRESSPRTAAACAASIHAACALCWCILALLVHLGQVHPLRGATLFRLMLDAMNILLLDEAVDFADAEAADLASLFLKVCQTQHNFTVMTDEMDRTYSELMKE